MTSGLGHATRRTHMSAYMRTRQREERARKAGCDRGKARRAMAVKPTGSAANAGGPLCVSRRTMGNEHQGKWESRAAQGKRGAMGR